MIDEGSHDVGGAIATIETEPKSEDIDWGTEFMIFFQEGKLSPNPMQAQRVHQ